MGFGVAVEHILDTHCATAEPSAVDGKEPVGTGAVPVSSTPVHHFWTIPGGSMSLAVSTLVSRKAKALPLAYQFGDATPPMTARLPAYTPRHANAATPTRAHVLAADAVSALAGLTHDQAAATQTMRRSHGPARQASR